MLYDSTKGLLQSILRSLQAGDETRWDDQTESGNACLYEMHQMSGPHYKAYRSDRLNANSVAQTSFPEKLNRAMPHVRTMVIAIRHKDRTRALESGMAALAEMNGTGPVRASDYSPGPRTENGTFSSVVRQHENATGKHHPVVEDRRFSRRSRLARSN